MVIRGGKGGWGNGNGGGKGGADILSVLKMLGMGGGSGGWGKGKGKGNGKDDSKKRTLMKLKEIDTDRKVWIGGLPSGVTWKDLEKHFESAATKPSLSEVMAKGTGVCAFKTAGEATAAIAAVNGTELKGNTLEVDVWTKKEKTEGEGAGSGDDKHSLVQKVKELQRSDPEAKAKWWAFTDEHHGGVHDPKKHTKEVLAEFLSGC